jgi:transposase
MRIIGLDIHRAFAEAVAWDDGKLKRLGRVDMRRPLLEAFAKKLSKDDVVVVEATGNASSVAAVIAPHVKKVVIANPMQVRIIAHAKIKTDTIDASVLAQLYASGFLPEVWIPDEPTQALRRQVTRRNQIVRQRSRLKNIIQSILHSHLIPSCPHADLCGASGRVWLFHQVLPEDERLAVERHLREFDRLDEDLKVIERDLARSAAKWKARSSVSDLPTGPKQPRSTVLSAEEEAVVVDDQSRTGGSVGERNLPAMRERNVARDRQAEPRAAGLAVARGFEPLKGLERPLEQFRGNPGSFVGDNDDPVARVLAKRDARCAAIAHGIVDQIREHPPDRGPLAEGRHMIRPVILCLRACIGRLVAKADEDGREVERSRRIGACIAFREAQRLRQHVSHRIDVGEHALAQFAVANELGLKPEPRERRAQIMRDRGEHMGALCHETLEPRLHGLERTVDRCKLADRRAWRFNNLGRPPKRVRRRRQLRERRDETPRGEHRDRGDKKRADEYES